MNSQVKNCVALLLLALAVCCSGSSSIAPLRKASESNGSSIPGQYITVFDKDVSRGAALRLIAQLMTLNSDQSKPEFSASPLQTFAQGTFAFAAQLSEEAVSWLRQQPEVSYMEEDQLAKAIAVQQNPTWGLDRIDDEVLQLDQTYSTNFDGAGVNVYVVDTGVYSSHEDFGGRVTSGFTSSDITDGRGSEDCEGHGTHCASTVAGNLYGVAKAATIVPVRVLNCQGSGSYSGIVEGIDWVIAQHNSGNRPSVASMSLGGGRSDFLNEAIQRLHNAGVTVAVAAGNENQDACNVSPASAPAAITVGATTVNDDRSSFSNWGTCVDIFAPGSSILGAGISSTSATATLSGTSMACPHVAGAAALILGSNGTLSSSQVFESIMCASRPNLITDVGSGSPNSFLHIPPSFTSSCNAVSCPNDCSGAGTCNRGVCSCNALRTGNDCSGSVQVPVLNPCQTTDVEGRLTASDTGLIGTTAPQKVFNFSVSSTTGFSASLCSSLTNFDTRLALFNSGFQTVASNDDGPTCSSSPAPYPPSAISGILQPGTYFLAVTGYSASTFGSFGLSISLSSTGACPSVPSIGFDGNSRRTVSEADGGITITLIGTGDLSRNPSVRVFTSDGSASAGSSGGYIAIDSRLSFSQGQSTRTVRVSVPNNNIAEGNRDFSLNIADANGAALGALRSISITITDDEEPLAPPPATTPAPGQCSVTYTDISDVCNAVDIQGTNVGASDVLHIGEGSGQAVYRFSLSSTTRVSFSLCSSVTNYDTFLYLLNSCPSSGSSYVASNDDSNARCSFTSTRYPPSTIPDSSEGYIELTAGTYYIAVGGYRASQGTFGLTIRPETGCAARTVGFQTSTARVSEGARQLNAAIVRSGETNFAVKVRVQAVPGSAGIPSDLPPLDTFITLSAGQTQAQVRVPVYDDAVHEASETFQLSLTVVAGAATVSIGTMTITIDDNDAAPVPTTNSPTQPPTTTAPAPGNGNCASGCSGNSFCFEGQCVCPCGMSGTNCTIPRWRSIDADTCSIPDARFSTSGAYGGKVVVPLSLEHASRVSLSTCSRFTDFDTILELFDGCPEASRGVPLGRRVARNDDGPRCTEDHTSRFQPSLLAYNFRASRQYYLVVKGYRRATGSFGLVSDVRESHACSDRTSASLSLVPPAPVVAGSSLELVIVRTGNLNQKVSGTVTMQDGTARLGEHYMLTASGNFEIAVNSTSATVAISTLQFSTTGSLTPRTFTAALSSSEATIVPERSTAILSIIPQAEQCSASNCVNGDCVDGVCQCRCGWQGSTCEDQAFPINDIPLNTFDLQNTTVGLESIFGRGPESVYRLNLASQTQIEIDLCSSNTILDTVIRVYTSCPSRSSRPYASNDDGRRCSAAPSRYPPSYLRLTVPQGDLFVSVTGYTRQQSGRYGITIKEAALATPSVPATSTSPQVQTTQIPTTSAPVSIPTTTSPSNSPSACPNDCSNAGACVREAFYGVFIHRCLCDCGRFGDDCSMTSDSMIVAQPLSQGLNSLSINASSLPQSTTTQWRMLPLVFNASYVSASFCGGSLPALASFSLWVGCPGSAGAYQIAHNSWRQRNAECAVQTSLPSTPELQGCFEGAYSERMHMVLEMLPAPSNYRFNVSVQPNCPAPPPPATSPQQSTAPAGNNSTCSIHETVRPCQNPSDTTSVLGTTSSSDSYWRITSSGFGPTKWIKVDLSSMHRSQRVSFSLCHQNTNFDVYMGLYRALCDATYIDFDDDGPSCSVSQNRYNPSRISRWLSPGVYFVAVTGFRGAVGNFGLKIDLGSPSACAALPTTPAPVPTTVAPTTAAPPANQCNDQLRSLDPCSGARITGETLRNDVSRIGNSAPEHVYNLTLNSRATVSINLCDSNTNYDTYIRVYRGDCLQTAQLVGLNDDGPSCSVDSARYNPSYLRISLAAGDYRIVVEGFRSSYGRYGMYVQADAAYCASNGGAQGAIISLANTTSTFTEGAHNFVTVQRVDSTQLATSVRFNVRVTNSTGHAVFDQSSYLRAYAQSQQVSVWIPLDGVYRPSSQIVSVTLNTTQQYARVENSNFQMELIEGDRDPCPNNCSSHGRCNPGVGCICDNGYSSDDCSVTSSTTILQACSHSITASNVGSNDLVMSAAGDRVYRLTIPSSGTWTFSTCTSATNFDTQLALSSIDPHSSSNPTWLSRNDDSGIYCSVAARANRYTSRIRRSLTQGQVVYLTVTGYSDYEGTFGLQITAPASVGACTSSNSVESRNSRIAAAAVFSQSSYLRSQTGAPTDQTIQAEDGKNSPIDISTSQSSPPSNNNWQAVIMTLPSTGLLFQTDDGESPNKLIDAVPAVVTHAERRVIFSPDSGRLGAAVSTFRVAVIDGGIESSPATITIDVSQSTDARNTRNLPEVSGQEDSSVVITVRAEGVSASDCHPVVVELPPRGRIFQYSASAAGFKGSDIFSGDLISDAQARVVFEPSPGTSGAPYAKFGYYCREEMPVGLSFAARAGSAGIGLLAAASGSSAGQVTVNVAQGNDPPVADNKAVRVALNNAVLVRLTGVDPENDQFTGIVKVLPTKGNLVEILNDGSTKNLNVNDRVGSNLVRWEPNSQDRGQNIDLFKYSLMDSNGAEGPVAQVDISVNLVPTPSSGLRATGLEDTDQDVVLQAIDADQQPVKHIIKSLPGTGSLFQRNADGSAGAQITVAGTEVTDPSFTSTQARVIYRPDENIATSTTFTFAATDGFEESATETVTVEVAGVNDAPTMSARAINFAARSSRAHIVSLRATDIDTADSSLQFRVVTLPANGNLYHTNAAGELLSEISSSPTLVSYAAVAFKPNENSFSGSVSFTVQAFDGQLNSNTVEYTLNLLSPVSKPPAQRVFVKAKLSLQGISSLSLQQETAIKSAIASNAGVTTDYVTIESVAAISRRLLAGLQVKVSISVPQSSATAASNQLSSAGADGSLTSSLQQDSSMSGVSASIESIEQSYAGAAVVTVQPNSGASIASMPSQLVIEYDQSISQGSGSISLNQGSKVFTVSASDLSVSGQKVVASLESFSGDTNGEWTVTVQPSAVLDAAGSHSAPPASEWKFTVQGKGETSGGSNLPVIIGASAGGGALLAAIIAFFVIRRRSGPGETSKESPPIATAPSQQVPVAPSHVPVQVPQAGENAPSQQMPVAPLHTAAQVPPAGLNFPIVGTQGSQNLQQQHAPPAYSANIAARPLQTMQTSGPMNAAAAAPGHSQATVGPPGAPPPSGTLVYSFNGMQPAAQVWKNAGQGPV